MLIRLNILLLVSIFFVSCSSSYEFLSKNSFNPSNKENHSCGSNFLKSRPDDTEKTVKNRIEIYTTQTLPIIDYYKDQKILHKIDAAREINKIYEEIRGIITSLET